MSTESYPYTYFSGANVTVLLDNEDLIECAGISFVVNEANQPAYGYASNLYDVVLPGRRIIQGSFVVNFNTSEDQHELVKDLKTNSFLTNRPTFNIDIVYGDKKVNVILQNCFLISRGQTIQVSENVILEEYGFIARDISKVNIINVL
tara:strand:- start:573 stop:1016 length:444 start_codon:yes stop_codon:yes gene_type:complete